MENLRRCGRSRSIAADVSFITLIAFYPQDLLEKKPSLKDNFIAVGGNSLLALNLYQNLIASLGCEDAKLFDLILHSSYEDIAIAIDNKVLSQAKWGSFSQATEDEGKFVKVISRGDMTNSAGRRKEMSSSKLMEIHWSYDTKKCVDASPLVALKK
jgi:hypothetical protein